MQVQRNSVKGFGASKGSLLKKIGRLCKKRHISGYKRSIPTKHVWYSLKRRYPDVTLRKPQKLGTVRARMLNTVVVSKYFDDLERVVDELGLRDQPARVWNCDETSKQFEHTPTRVVASKQSRNVVGRVSNDRTSMTVMACGNAEGQIMPPMLIVKGKTVKSLYGYNTADGPDGTMWTFQENAWMDDDLGAKWFKEIFLANCGPVRPQLLILDGHSSHESLQLLENAEEENVHVMAFPPHTTHYLQPFDRAVFGPFNRAYNAECTEFLNAATCNIVNKWTYPGLLKKAWEKGVTSENVRSGFKACGIYPLDRMAIPADAFMPSYPFDSTNAEPNVPSADYTFDTKLPLSCAPEIMTSGTAPSLNYTVASSYVSSSTTHFVPSVVPSLHSSVATSFASTSTSFCAEPPRAHCVVPCSFISTASTSTGSIIVPPVARPSVDIPLDLSFKPPLVPSAVTTTPGSSATFSLVPSSVCPDVVSAPPSVLVPTDAPYYDTTPISGNTPLDFGLNGTNAVGHTVTQLGDAIGPSGESQDPKQIANTIEVQSVTMNNPRQLLDMIDSGGIEVVATADDMGVANVEHAIECRSWSEDIHAIFEPQGDEKPRNKTVSKRKITSHRLLTHASIMQMKRDEEEKKKLKMEKAVERKEKAVERKQKAIERKQKTIERKEKAEKRKLEIATRKAEAAERKTNKLSKKA